MAQAQAIGTPIDSVSSASHSAADSARPGRRGSQAFGALRPSAETKANRKTSISASGAESSQRSAADEMAIPGKKLKNIAAAPKQPSNAPTTPIVG